MPAAIHAISLPSGQVAIVDAADRDVVEQYRWFALVCRHTTYVNGYLRGRHHRDRVRVMLHRILIEVPAELDVDHRNRNGLDNRRGNLRVGTRSQNNGNTVTRPGLSGYRGVSLTATGRWRAYINRDHRQRHLGVFDDPWMAALAFNAAALDQWGEFARLNVRAVA